MTAPQLEVIETAIDRGLSALQRGQLPSGQFNLDFMTVDLSGDVRLLYAEKTPFGTAHIVYSLGFLSHPVARDMIPPALNFLMGERHEPGLWRYFNRGHHRYFINPLDLDDTACVSYLLEKHGWPAPPNKEMLLHNRNSHGQFYTWLIPRLRPIPDLHFWLAVLRNINYPRAFLFWKQTPARRNDVDGVVNANVLWYLGQRPETEAVIDYLIDIVQSGKEDHCDAWYRNRYPYYYAFSRCYASGISRLGSVRQSILERLQADTRREGQIGANELQTALAACTLLNFEDRSGLLEVAIGFLLYSQQENGAWPRWPFYYGGTATHFFWGSQELTTAFCLEALERYRGLALARPGTPDA